MKLSDRAFKFICRMILIAAGFCIWAVVDVSNQGSILFLIPAAMILFPAYREFVDVEREYRKETKLILKEKEGR